MKNNIVKIGVLLLGINLAACLDDSKYALDPNGTNNVIEFYDPSVPSSPSGAVYPAWVRAFPLGEEDQFEQIINYAGPNSNDKDIVLELEVDPLALEEYNTQLTVGLNGADPLDESFVPYELLPEDLYDIADLTVTIPKGERTATVSVTIYPNDFDLSKRFALPLRIKSASSGVLSAHFSVGIFAIVIKNEFDAAYDLAMWTTGWQAYGIYNSMVFLDYPNPGMGLATTGPNTVQCVNLWAGSNLLPGATTTGFTQFGNASPIFTFDLNLTSVDIDANPATPPVMVNKLLSVTNGIFPNPAGRQFEINPSAAASDNWFNPADRSANFNFLLKATGRPDMTNYFNLTFRAER